MAEHPSDPNQSTHIVTPENSSNRASALSKMNTTEHEMRRCAPVRPTGAMLDAPVMDPRPSSTTVRGIQSAHKDLTAEPNDAVNSRWRVHPQAPEPGMGRPRVSLARFPMRAVRRSHWDQGSGAV